VKRILLLLALLPSLAGAANIYSIGNGFWTNAVNWPGGVLPGAADSVFATNSLVINTSQTVSNLTISGGVTVTMSNLITLAINDTATIDSSTLQIARGSVTLNNLGISTSSCPLILNNGTINGTGGNSPTVNFRATKNGATNDLASITNGTVVGLTAITLGGALVNATNSVWLARNLVFSASQFAAVALDGYGTVILDGSTLPGIAVGSAYRQVLTSFGGATINGRLQIANAQVFTNTVNLKF
jgi:hypothetical protein